MKLFLFMNVALHTCLCTGKELLIMQKSRVFRAKQANPLNLQLIYQIQAESSLMNPTNYK